MKHSAETAVASTVVRRHVSSRRSTIDPGASGLLVSVLRDARLGDCTNGGISSRYDSFTLIGDGVEGPFEPSERTPALVLVKREFARGTYLHAEPIERPEGKRGPMFGGNFITTSDSRFPNDYPIPIHDRFE